MKPARQYFPDFNGQVTYADPVHKDGFTIDRNGSRWVGGAWRPRRGLSQLNGGTATDVPISSVRGFRGLDGRKHLMSVQSNTWIAQVLPSVIWDDA